MNSYPLVKEFKMVMPRNGKGRPSPFFYLLPTIIGILVMTGGWIANWSANATVQRDHERRIEALESGTVTRIEHTSAQQQAIQSQADLKQGIADIRQDVRDLRQEVRSLRGR